MEKNSLELIIAYMIQQFHIITVGLNSHDPTIIPFKSGGEHFDNVSLQLMV